MFFPDRRTAGRPETHVLVGSATVDLREKSLSPGCRRRPTLPLPYVRAQHSWFPTYVFFTSRRCLHWRGRTRRRLQGGPSATGGLARSGGISAGVLPLPGVPV